MIRVSIKLKDKKVIYVADMKTTPRKGEMILIPDEDDELIAYTVIGISHQVKYQIDLIAIVDRLEE